MAITASTLFPQDSRNAYYEQNKADNFKSLHNIRSAIIRIGMMSTVAILAANLSPIYGVTVIPKHLLEKYSAPATFFMLAVTVVGIAVTRFKLYRLENPRLNASNSITNAQVEALIERCQKVSKVKGLETAVEQSIGVLDKYKTEMAKPNNCQRYRLDPQSRNGFKAFVQDLEKIELSLMSSAVKKEKLIELLSLVKKSNKKFDIALTKHEKTIHAQQIPQSGLKGQLNATDELLVEVAHANELQVIKIESDWHEFLGILSRSLKQLLRTVKDDEIVFIHPELKSLINHYDAHVGNEDEIIINDIQKMLGQSKA